MSNKRGLGLSNAVPMLDALSDSGSLVVNERGAAVGLLFAVSETGVAYVNPIEPVLAGQDVRLTPWPARLRDAAASPVPRTPHGAPRHGVGVSRKARCFPPMVPVPAS